jgi:hypothetical protein
MKIVLNGCYGGFGLSYEAMYLYLYAKTGQEPYFYVDMPTWNGFALADRKYKRITLQEITKYPQNYIYCVTKDQGPVLDHFPSDVFNSRDADRTDPILISVVETIGTKSASGKYAQLFVDEVPDGTLYQIEEYDGAESILTQDDEDWKVASSQIQPYSTKHYIETIWNIIKPDDTEEED